MKKPILTVIACLCMSNFAFANTDKEVSMEELPNRTRLFVQTYFDDTEFDTIVQRDKNGVYQLGTDEGWLFTFGTEGEWIDLDCHEDRVPSPVIPSKILNTIARKYGTDVKVVKITITRRGNYMIKLSNYVRLAFDKRCREIKIK